VFSFRSVSRVGDIATEQGNTKQGNTEQGNTGQDDRGRMAATSSGTAILTGPSAQTKKTLFIFSRPDDYHAQTRIKES
jgi:hypothetical protein